MLEPDFSERPASPPDKHACSRRTQGPRRCGNKVILDRLYRRERDPIRAFLAREVGKELARDLAQEVFLRAATSDQLGRLRNPASFLRRIARNLVIDLARRDRRRVSTVPLIEGRIAAADTAQEQVVAAHDVEAALAAALAALPTRTETIFRMNRFEQKTYREIHIELGITVPAVEYHIMKALEHLRAAICERE